MMMMRDYGGVSSRATMSTAELLILLQKAKTLTTNDPKPRTTRTPSLRKYAWGVAKEAHTQRSRNFAHSFFNPVCVETRVMAWFPRCSNNILSLILWLQSSSQAAY
jgi:hypothetical protein